MARFAGAPLRFLLLILIKTYRFVTSGLAPRCRFYPTCSAYAEEAIRARGGVAGSVLAVWRVLRCNPFSRGGVDYVPHSAGYEEVIHCHLSGASR